MSIDEKKKLLALHRLQQAAESLQEAQYLFAGGESGMTGMGSGHGNYLILDQVVLK
jgi:hypothetical protein